MMFNSMPRKQGLYDPQYEHDACGIGFIANIKGKKSHEIIRQAVTILANLDHRGGSGAEENTGDGAGILIQISHNFFSESCKQLGISLPDVGQYGVGMLFLPQDEEARLKLEANIVDIVEDEGQKVLGVRTVPINVASLGKGAKDSMPCIRQVFIGLGKGTECGIAFERKLYIIRKRLEGITLESGQKVYPVSMSSRTIIYKGMLTAGQVDEYYQDLKDPLMDTAIALVHSRYSTNTFPSWERAHPYRYLIHNGEINTLRGNINWMNARQRHIQSEVFGKDMSKILPIINQDGSDSAMFDNCFEFLVLAGRPIEHAMMMMIPEPWSKHESMSDEKKAFYEYHRCFMEPWDGPAAMAFTDGIKVGAVLDRNGLRPARYCVTKDDLVIMSSEVGVLDIPAENIICKERLHPGRMLLIDTNEGRIINDDEIKSTVAKQHPYRQWLDDKFVHLKDLPAPLHTSAYCEETIVQKQKAFGYTYEDLRKTLEPIGSEGADPVGAMGHDVPLAVLSQRSQLLYEYFKQLFSQVTNPPIDAIREELVTSTEVLLGAEGNLLRADPANCKRIKIKHPIIYNKELEKIKNVTLEGFRSVTIPILFPVSEGEKGLESAMQRIFDKADRAINKGANILVLSDREINKNNVAIPALLAVAGLHHHLIENGKRTSISIVLESGEPREVHHFCALLGYGASAINPYLAFESLQNMVEKGIITNLKMEEVMKNFKKAAVKGITKVLSKMGISTIHSYRGAQIFEAVGIGKDVIDKYFKATPSRVGGIDIEGIAHEALERHSKAFDETGCCDDLNLESGGYFQWRKDGEEHLYNPETIHKLQMSCRTNDYKLFKEYSKMINNQTQKASTLRGLLEFKNSQSVPIEDVESVESICKRFKTGAMSYGSISQEAHECMAIAMNRIGGKSNTGEGGEIAERFTPDTNGDSRCSKIKQVASGRFGVTSHYLVNAEEIQIKMAQGAKPGEGGQLPGGKVTSQIAKARHSTPGVGLISPPPHHDIYSIEDLAELIHDLKNANRDAKINVKLVSEVGVGTIAAGVAKGRADIILISGYDGGTGASPRTSIRHTGLPWELGLAEAHQTLLLNGLRGRVKLETDGKLMTGRDVAIAALLGAEEFGFATTALVVLGCVMMRVCNLDTCPVGIATQNPELRKRFAGKPEYVIEFMHFIAEELREVMAELGFRTVNEMIGRVDMLQESKSISHWKAKSVDLSALLYMPDVPKEVARYCIENQNHEIDKSMDVQTILELCKPALERGEKVNCSLKIRNINRVVGTVLGSEISKRYGANGLPDNTIQLNFEGSAGQSFGAFVPNGVTLRLEGEANDYIGKGLCGGKVIVYPPNSAEYKAEKNIVIGNVAFYGATDGEAYIRGIAGERFCVRNSGVNAVVEGVGDHGCEYMTGGMVVVLGATGRNFAAGMSGGIAYVLDGAKDFKIKCNKEMVILENIEDSEDSLELENMIRNHLEYTRSDVAKKILDDWDIYLTRFIKVIPIDYKYMMMQRNRI